MSQKAGLLLLIRHNFISSQHVLIVFSRKRHYPVLTWLR